MIRALLLGLTVSAIIGIFYYWVVTGEPVVALR